MHVVTHTVETNGGAPMFDPQHLTAAATVGYKSLREPVYSSCTP